MNCKMCNERGKSWEGSDPICAFIDGQPFSAISWNCATVNAVRDLCSRNLKEEYLAKGIQRQFDDDQWYATVNVSDIERFAQVLWLTWYKDRGRTEAMWLLSYNDEPRRPTEADLLVIIKWYAAKVPA